ncbi:MAG TPA: PAAR domain-containing protein [Polyangiales bacterium]|nr:PAAR domain-containing protein [Polyangiales bacterium]
MIAPSGVIGPPVTPPTSGLVNIEGLPAAYVTCTVVCTGATSTGMAHPPPGGVAPPPVPIVIGSLSVKINGFPAARWIPSQDVAACTVFLGDPKLAATRTVHIGGPVMPGALSGKILRVAQRKYQIGLSKYELSQMDEDDDEREELQEAVERFERNNKNIEKAKLCADVYSPEKGPPVGWKNISKDPEELAKLGLDPENLSAPGSDYRAQVYRPDPAVFGEDQKTTLVFKGTTPSSGEDWQNNLAQGQDKDSLYYEKAVTAGKMLDNSGADVDIAGHSLGGGMAEGASRASGRPAVTFNAAGLHPNTVEHYGGSVHEAASGGDYVTAYRVDNEMLTGIQEHSVKGTAFAGLLGGALGALVGNPMLGAELGVAAKLYISSQMPNAGGTKYSLPGSSHPISRHSMDQVIAGLEEQKEEDWAVLTGS